VNLRSAPKFLGIRILMEEYSIQLKLIFIGVRPWTLGGVVVPQIWEPGHCWFHLWSLFPIRMTNRMRGQPHFDTPYIHKIPRGWLFDVVPKFPSTFSALRLPNGGAKRRQWFWRARWPLGPQS
jgi:hypothetical protein